jgi:hypothetical protein
MILTATAFTATAPEGSGLSIALAESGKAKRQYMRLGITAAAQLEHFGRMLTDDDAVALEIDNAAGKNHALKIKIVGKMVNSAIMLSGGIKDSRYCKVVPWNQVAPGKRPAERMIIISNNSDMAVICRLPDWARPRALKIGEGEAMS